MTRAAVIRDPATSTGLGQFASIQALAPSLGVEPTELVAEGHTNREVAAALFLTEHSVETALTRVYRKLGVRSRAELARLLAPKT